MNQIIIYFGIFATIFLLDLIWLGFIAKSLYQEELANFLRPHFSFFSAIIVYLLLSIGIYFFVLINPFSNSYRSLAIIGAVFGIIVYGIYEFTNYSLINDWPIKIVIIDIIWGSILCSISAVVGRILFNP